MSRPYPCNPKYSDTNFNQAFNSLDQAPDECTPEKRMWIMVLETFVDDMILHNKYIKASKKRMDKADSWLKIGHQTTIKRHNKEKLTLIQKANAPHIVEICGLINLCHTWFMRGLNKIANSPDFTYRPGRVADKEI